MFISRSPGILLWLSTGEQMMTSSGLHGSVQVYYLTNATYKTRVLWLSFSVPLFSKSSFSFDRWVWGLRLQPQPRQVSGCYESYAKGARGPWLVKGRQYPSRQLGYTAWTTHWATTSRATTATHNNQRHTKGTRQADRRIVENHARQRYSTWHWQSTHLYT